jgi:hypothetical protein
MTAQAFLSVFAKNIKNDYIELRILEHSNQQLLLLQSQ